MVLEIPNHPNYYISDSGKVYKALSNGRGLKELQANMSNGHARVSIDGENYYLARLVLETFDPPYDRGLKTFHIDGDYSNNDLMNLVWLTPSEVQLYSSYSLEYRKQSLGARE